MDIIEVEENLFLASDAKLHGEMCKELYVVYCKISSIFPSLEAARPRSKSGIQALCLLHIALEKTKIILKHCSECSKLYLAITEGFFPQSIGCQILEIVSELESTEFSLDPSEKQVGDEIIALLQQGGKFDNSNDNNELESFHQAAIKIGITSSRAALSERRALKKLIERARVEEDKRKESIGSLEDGGPGGNGHAFERQLSKLSSFNFKPIYRKSGQMPLPPEELRCPISLHLMYDPVIIASGQTYERICIEKWFSDGHDSCPKTQQRLSHLCLTPNYCVKGLVASWCEHNGVPAPDGPPESLDLNYWRLAMSQSDSSNSRRSVESVSSGKLKGVKVVPLEESGPIEEAAEKTENLSPQQEDSMLEDAFEDNVFERYQNFLNILNGDEDLKKKCRIVEQVRLLLKDDEEARIFMGANGFVEALLQFLESAVQARNPMAEEVGAMALFNLTVNNNRNKEMMLAAGAIPLLEDMISNPDSDGSATALYLNLSCLDEAKSIIGSSQALASSAASNPLLAVPGDHSWIEKSIAVLINLASSQSAKDEMLSTPGLISGLATILDTVEPIEQEQAVACLYVLCNGSEKGSQLVLQEGVIPALVSISVNGTTRGKEKAQKLLMLFREQRQQDQPSADVCFQQTESSSRSMPAPESKPQCKPVPRRKMGKAISFFWKSKSYSVYQC
ncbi:U-BOX DOMAIN-CONTAINING PROTEIN 7 [Salix purpurea]|uniref:RING-type E3 ubiquitin transferase n=1 Tax=Salix purpurea TaxID=77065 RepID=A0A9Q0U980_SALPP|nr:U-BOX DOMAIN-CONTAINING PROTEIN 7 [Salix purpurea]